MNMTNDNMIKKILVTKIRSEIRRPSKQGRILSSLGLTKMNSKVIVDDIPTVKGMINKILHLVKVEELL